MPIQIIAITARNAPIGDPFPDIERLIGQAGFAGGIIRRMSDYPAQRPTKYRRTGTLGRNWRMVGLSRVGDTITSTVVNKTDYVVHVEGPPTGEKGRRQTAVMRDKGWPNIQRAAEAEWRTWRPQVVRVLATNPRRRPL